MGIELVAGAMGAIGGAVSGVAGAVGAGNLLAAGTALTMQNLAQNEARYQAALARNDIKEANRLAAEIQRQQAELGIKDIQASGTEAQKQYDPYIQAGESALEQLKAAQGLPSSTTFNPVASDAYRLRERLGTEAINRQLASKGFGGSKVGMKSQREFIGSLTADEANAQIQRLQNLASMGFAGAQGKANIVSNTGTNMANIRSGLAGNLSGLAQSSGQAGAQYNMFLGGQAQDFASNVGMTGYNLINVARRRELENIVFPPAPAQTQIVNPMPSNMQQRQTDYISRNYDFLPT